MVRMVTMITKRIWMVRLMTKICETKITTMIWMILKVTKI